MKKTGKKDEKGSALLLTLGILSLALILGMSFAFSARTSRQVAKVNADQVKAKLLAESGLERVLASIKFACTTSPLVPLPVKLYPSTKLALYFNKSLNDSDGNDYVIHYGVTDSVLGPDTSDASETGNSFETILLGNSDLAKYINDNVGELSLENAGFQTIEDSDGNVIGRFGFMIMEESGKVDINRIIPLRLGTGNMPFVVKGEDRINGKLSLAFDEKDYYYPVLSAYYSDSYDYNAQIDWNVADDDFKMNTIRMGVHPMEIGVSSIDYLKKLVNGFPGSGTTIAATKAQWFSYDHLRNDIGGDFDKDFFKYTFFSSDAEEESYTYDFDLMSLKYSRFDITGYELGDHSSDSFYDSDKYPIQGNAACAWPSSTDLTALADFMSDIKGSGEEFPNIQTAIPWLAKMKDKDGNSVTDQVIANMIDFCDTDSIPARPIKDDKSGYEDQYTDKVFKISGTAFEIEDDDIKAPDFWGNEDVAYINEINFKFLVMREKDETAGVENTKYHYQFIFMPQIELANVCADNVVAPKHVKVRLCGSITIKNQGATTDRFTFAQDSNPNIMWFDCESVGTFSTDGYAVCKLSGNDYRKIADFSDPYKHKVANPLDPTEFKYLPGGVDFNVNITKIVVMTQDNSTEPEAQDYAYFEKDLQATFEVPEFTNFDDVVLDWYKVYEISLECADSRFNHKTSGWSDTGSAALIDRGDDGVASDFSDLADIGNYDSLAAFNTKAYNDKVGSLTEGEDYDKEENPTSSIKYSTAYIKDAPFDSLWELGCIHRGEPFRTINLKKYTANNASASGTYKDGDAVILDQVKIGPAKYGYKYNANSQNIGILKNILLNNINTADDYEAPTDSGTFSGTLDFTGINPTRSRAVLANAITGTFDNDRAAEAYIGRTANLLGTRHDAFTLFIVAQPMRQYDSDDVPDDTVWDEIKDTVVNPTIYTHNGTKAYCSILGTQVIVVQFVRDTLTNEFTILHKHYANND